MNSNKLTDMQKMSSKINAITSFILMILNVVYVFTEKGNHEIISAAVCGAVFLMDVLMASPLFEKRKIQWIILRCVQLLFYSFAFNWLDNGLGTSYFSILLLVVMFELVFSFDYGDTYTRVVTYMLCIVPAVFILVMDMLLTSLDSKLIFEKACVLLCISVIYVILTNITVAELNKIEQKLFEQRRLADNTKEINEALKIHQEKVKKANEELGVQKIKLEAAYNRINSANTEMILQNEILKQITSVLEVEKLLSIMTKALTNDLGLHCCGILLKREAAGNEEAICSIHSMMSKEKEEALEQRLLGGCMDGYMAHTGGFVDNHVGPDSYDFMEDRDAGSILILPMTRENAAVGVLMAVHKRFDYFTDNRVFFDTIMAQFMIALDNAGLYARVQQMAIRDSLTGIYNRGHLNLMMEKFSAQAEKDGAPLSVALFDIDHFKRINDTYGHLFGDLVIKTVASFAKEMARKHRGFAARYGGEEFVLAFPQKDVDTCCAIVEEMRRKIQDMKLEYDGIYVSVNVSVGVTCYPQCCKKQNVLLEHADWAMYYSKKHGRNRVTVDSEDIRNQLGLAENVQEA